MFFAVLHVPALSFVKGDVVIPNPIFGSGPGREASRPGGGRAGGDDRTLCQITRRHFRDRYALGIIDADFEEGSPKKETNVSPTGSSPPTAG